MKKYRYGIVTLLLMLVAGIQAHAVKDTIYFQGGDRITATIKSLNNNQLRGSTSNAGTIRVEWDKVDSVVILNTMRIVLDDGRIFYGTIIPSGTEKSGCILRNDQEPIIVMLIQIVLLSPLEETFLNSLDGLLGAGLSYTKASDVLQMHFDGNLSYSAQKNQLDLFYSGVFTREPDLESSQNQSGGATFRRYLPGRWFLLGLFNAESNSELQLDLRLTTGVGGGNSLILNNTMNLFVAGGILMGREVVMDMHQYNVEAKVVVNYTVYIYDSPEISLSVDGSLIPSLNDPGRIRTELRSAMKWEIFNDLYLKWSFYHIYDSRPLSGGEEERSDWGINTLGMEFNL